MRNWPQLLVLFDLGFVFALTCALAGRSRGVYSPIGGLISISVALTVLYFGGFFGVWGASP